MIRSHSPTGVLDVHHPEGFWVDGNDCIHVYHGRRVSIPYRSLYSRNVTNLMMAGRCLSATHIALGATRVMRPCMGMGQAAGTAAAITVHNDTSPQGIFDDHIELLQQTLMKDGCYLIGIEGHDPKDLAKRATVDRIVRERRLRCEQSDRRVQSCRWFGSACMVS